MAGLGAGFGAGVCGHGAALLVRVFFEDVVTDDADSMTRIRALDTGRTAEPCFSFEPAALAEIRRPLQTRIENKLGDARLYPI